MCFSPILKISQDRCHVYYVQWQRSANTCSASIFRRMEFRGLEGNPAYWVYELIVSIHCGSSRVELITALLCLWIHELVLTSS